MARADIRDQLSKVFDFRGIQRAELEHLVAHMLSEQYLFEAGGTRRPWRPCRRVVSADDFQLRIDGDSVTPQAVFDIVDRMRGDELWADRRLWTTTRSRRG